MLVGGTDPLYRQALAAGHEPYQRVEVWRGGELLEEDLVVIGGTVNATLASRVARTVTVTVPEELYPETADDVLWPFSGAELKVFRGVVFADGESFVWPLFRGKIQDVTLDDNTCTVNAEDRGGEVADAAFGVPENSTVGAPVVTEFQRLVADGVADATFGVSDEFFQRMPRVTWEQDRAGALDDIATGAGAFWYALANGDFVMRKVPWTVPGDPVVTLTDGDGGTVLAATARRSRRDAYNSVTVTGERADGTAPLYYTAQDDNPASPTYVQGPFGVRSRVVRMDAPSGPAAVRDAARTLLRRSTAFTESWSLSCVTDAAMELGDVLRLDVRDRQNVVQVVAGLAWPLEAAGYMRVACRAQVLGTLEVA